jgi:mutator protein MutT
MSCSPRQSPDRTSIMNSIRVVAAVIGRDGRLLICERPQHKRHGGLWEFPGGKVERGETEFAAVQRELREELGVEVMAVGNVEYCVADPGSRFVIEFLPVAIVGEPVCHEHTRLKWVSPSKLLSYALAPSDHQYAVFLKNRSNDFFEHSSGTAEWL